MSYAINYKSTMPEYMTFQEDPDTALIRPHDVVDHIRVEASPKDTLIMEANIALPPAKDRANTLRARGLPALAHEVDFLISQVEVALRSHLPHKEQGDDVTTTDDEGPSLNNIRSEMATMSWLNDASGLLRSYCNAISAAIDQGDLPLARRRLERLRIAQEPYLQERRRNEIEIIQIQDAETKRKAEFDRLEHEERMRIKAERETKLAAAQQRLDAENRFHNLFSKAVPTSPGSLSLEPIPADLYGRYRAMDLSEGGDKQLDRLSPRARELYEEFDRQALIANEAQIVATYPEVVGKSKSSVLGSPHDPEHVVKLARKNKFPRIQSSQLHEGPLMRTLTQLLVEAGYRSDYLPSVVDYGLTDKGHRWTRMERITDIKPILSLEASDLPRLVGEDLFEIVHAVSQLFPVFEKHGFAPAGDTKVHEFVRDGVSDHLRLIDFDVYCFNNDTEVSNYPHEVEMLYKRIAVAFIFQLKSINKGLIERYWGARGESQRSVGFELLATLTDDDYNRFQNSRLVYNTLTLLLGLSPNNTPITHETIGQLFKASS